VGVQRRAARPRRGSAAGGGFIFTIHFFNGHLRPEKFPMDMVIFTGHRQRGRSCATSGRREYERLVRDRLEITGCRARPHAAGVDGQAAVGTTAVIRRPDAGRADRCTGCSEGAGVQGRPREQNEQDRSRFVRNWISISGVMAHTVSAILSSRSSSSICFGIHANPYIGIVFFLIIPGIFILGLLLIPHRHVAGAPAPAGRPPVARHWPRLDLNDPVHRRDVFAVLVLTMVNVIIVSLAAYRGIEYMDSVVLRRGVPRGDGAGVRRLPGRPARARRVRPLPHRPGAPWFVRSKLDGVRQVFAVPSTVTPAHPHAGRQPAPGPRGLRAVPLAREVPRRQDPS
jgi:hypothetical protein